MIDWKVYFGASPNQSSYAKDAKVGPLTGDKPSFADLHMNFDHNEPPILEAVLKGQAIELWSDRLGERFWLVADEADGARLGEPRGTVYTAAEARRVVQIADSATVAEVHAWKRKFDGVIR